GEGNIASMAWGGVDRAHRDRPIPDLRRRVYGTLRTVLFAPRPGAGAASRGKRRTDPARPGHCRQFLWRLSFADRYFHGREGYRQASAGLPGRVHIVQPDADGAHETVVGWADLPGHSQWHRRRRPSSDDHVAYECRQSER